MEEADMKCGLSENKRFVVISLLPNSQILLSRRQALDFVTSMLEEVMNLEEDSTFVEKGPPQRSPKAQ